MLAGPRRASLTLAATPVGASLLARPVLGERLDPLAETGIAVVIAGLLLSILGHDRGAGEYRDLPRRRIYLGLAGGLVCAVCTAVGNVLAKLGMPGETSPLEATLVRGLWAAVGMGIFVLLRPSAWRDARRLGDPRVWRPLTIAIVIGPFIGMWLAVASLKFTEAGVASVLMNTMPITILLPAWLFHRDKPSPMSLLGVVVALAGGALLFLR